MAARCRIYERITARCRRTMQVGGDALGAVRTTILPTPIPPLGADVLERSGEATDCRIANTDSVGHAGDELLRPNDILKARRRNSVCYAMNVVVGLTQCLPYR